MLLLILQGKNIERPNEILLLFLRLKYNRLYLSVSTGYKSSFSICLVKMLCLKLHTNCFFQPYRYYIRIVINRTKEFHFSIRHKNIFRPGVYTHIVTQLVIEKEGVKLNPTGYLIYHNVKIPFIAFVCFRLIYQRLNVGLILLLIVFHHILF